MHTKKPDAIHQQDNKILMSLSSYPEWPLLIDQFNKLQSQSLKQLFFDEPSRCERCQLTSSGITLDYSLQPINQESMFLLTELASRHSLKERINDLFSGKNVNITEKKPALHTALRADKDEVIDLDGENINALIQNTLKKMEIMSWQIRNHKWLGYLGEPITDVVNIGIGGSDFGPKMAIAALHNYVQGGPSTHFISDSDPDSFDDVVNQLNPATTLFIIASKTFTTKESLLNLQKARVWLGTNSANQMIAVTAYPERAVSLGISHVLPIWDWIGGRYSFFSAINLILMFAIGSENFYRLIAGARDMDYHFKTAPFSRNMPILLALIGIWNLNFFCANNHLLLIYSKRLIQLIPFLQQLDMESNGKSLNIQGSKLEHTTGPIIWGGLGNQAEHAFYQHLYQGSHYIPMDCLFLGEERYALMNQAAFNKLSPLALGSNIESNSFKQENNLMLRNAKAGINKIILNELSPYTLGALVALYEHKIYCQSIIWNINAFDQPGIEAIKLVGTISRNEHEITLTNRA